MKETVHIFANATNVSLIMSVIDNRPYAAEAFMMQAKGGHYQTIVDRSELQRIEDDLSKIPTPAFAMIRASRGIKSGPTTIIKGDIIIKEPDTPSGGTRIHTFT